MALIIKKNKNIKRLFEDGEQNTQAPVQQNTQPTQAQQNTQQNGVSTQNALDWAYATYIFQRSVIGFKQGLVQNLQQSGLLGRIDTLNKWVNSQFGQLGNNTSDAKSLEDATNNILKSFNQGLTSLNNYKQNISKDVNSEKVYEQALSGFISGKKYEDIQKELNQNIEQNTQAPQSTTQAPIQQQNQPTQAPAEQPTQAQHPSQQNESIKLTLENKLFEDKFYKMF